MKKSITILAMMIMFASCATETEVIIDGCQYIKVENYNADGFIGETLVHKGSCTNPIHDEKQTVTN